MLDEHQGGRFDRTKAKELRKAKLKNFQKQEQEIFDPKFDLKKSKAINQKLYKQRNYANDASRPYEDDSDSEKPDETSCYDVDFDSLGSEGDLFMQELINSGPRQEG